MECALGPIRDVMEDGMQVTHDKCTPPFLSSKEILSAFEFPILFHCKFKFKSIKQVLLKAAPGAWANSLNLESMVRSAVSIYLASGY